MNNTTKAGHTPGPWQLDHECISANGVHISMAIGPDTATYAEQVANAARIVACVNACEHLADPENAVRSYRADMDHIQGERDKAEAERDALRAECARLREALQMVCDSGVALADPIEAAMVAALTGAQS